MLDSFRSLSDRACHADVVVDGDIVEPFCEPPERMNVKWRIARNGKKRNSFELVNCVMWLWWVGGWWHLLSVALGCTGFPLPRFDELVLLAGGRPFRFFVGGGSSLSKRLCRFPRCDIFARSLSTTHFKFFWFSANKCSELAITLLGMILCLLFACGLFFTLGQLSGACLSWWRLAVVAALCFFARLICVRSFFFSLLHSRDFLFVCFLLLWIHLFLF